MKKIIRLTESDLARIVKRVISEQSIPEDYIETTPVGRIIDTKEKYDKTYSTDFKYYVNDNKNISFIYDGTNLVFIKAPEDAYKNFRELGAKFGPYKLQDVIKYL